MSTARRFQLVAIAFCLFSTTTSVIRGKEDLGMWVVFGLAVLNAILFILPSPKDTE